MSAAGWGHTETVLAMLQHGVGAWMDQALSEACHMNHISSVEVLLQYGADSNANRGRSLRSACGRPALVEMLLEHGANVNEVWLSDLSNNETLRLFLQHGANVHDHDDRALLLVTFSHIRAADGLRHARSKSATEEAQRLLDSRKETIAILLQYGADIQSQNGNVLRRLPYENALKQLHSSWKTVLMRMRTKTKLCDRLLQMGTFGWFRYCCNMGRMFMLRGMRLSEMRFKTGTEESEMQWIGLKFDREDFLPFLHSWSIESS
ncbi:hypothetical protein DFJ77DRAFT_443887 [Powellomyces hirtus]|nr:hypothetical protein DFJ77DRAFT_443887 [Powellomyces hirtus]